MDALCAAVRHGAEEVVERLVNVEPGLIFIRHPRYDTPLRVACCSGRADIVKLLLDKGAPVDYATQGGGTVLFWACFHQKEEVVGLLLERGANPGIRQEHNWTPLMVAACKGSVRILELLLRHEACTGEEALYQALWTACCFGQVEPIRPLLRAGADFLRPNKRGTAMAEFARKKGHHSCADIVEEAERVYAIHRARQLQDEHESLLRCCAAGYSPVSPMGLDYEQRPVDVPQHLIDRVQRRESLPLVVMRAVEGCEGVDGNVAKRGRDAMEVATDGGTLEVLAATAEFVVSGSLKDDLYKELMAMMRP